MSHGYISPSGCVAPWTAPQPWPQLSLPVADALSISLITSGKPVFSFHTFCSAITQLLFLFFLLVHLCHCSSYFTPLLSRIRSEDDRRSGPSQREREGRLRHQNKNRFCGLLGIHRKKQGYNSSEMMGKWAGFIMSIAQRRPLTVP